MNVILRAIRWIFPIRRDINDPDSGTGWFS